MSVPQSVNIQQTATPADFFVVYFKGSDYDTTKTVNCVFVRKQDKNKLKHCTYRYDGNNKLVIEQMYEYDKNNQLVKIESGAECKKPVYMYEPALTTSLRVVNEVPDRVKKIFDEFNRDVCVVRSHSFYLFVNPSRHFKIDSNSNKLVVF